jgi:hexosaminidase
MLHKTVANAMRKIILALFTLSVCMNVFSQSRTGSPAIIPEPVSMQVSPGHFVLPRTVLIDAPQRPELMSALQDLAIRLSVPTGFSVTILKTIDPSATIHLQLNKKAEPALGDEGYHLSITPSSVLISANQSAGLFYGIQTFFQLLPKEIESAKAVKKAIWEAPCVTITDYPRFGWRGLMFDVSRHFFTKQEVKDFVDEMVKYKYNLLHLHLTDDEGWRIEIKSLPRLTEVGAWNVHRVGTFGTFSAPTADEPRNYGGFYTQDDIREMVK